MPLNEKDISKIVKLTVKQLTKDLHKTLADKSDIKEVGKNIDTNFAKIEKHLIEIKAEMREVRKLYQAWAHKHMAPEFMEKYLRDQQKLRSQKPKRVD